jgi:hypothetical protein
MAEGSGNVDERDIGQRRRAALRHAIILGLVSMGFLAMFILKTVTER